jgi:hypothetical protein
MGGGPGGSSSAIVVGMSDRKIIRTKTAVLSFKVGFLYGISDIFMFGFRIADERLERSCPSHFEANPKALNRKRSP